jgi:hypothetical protein
MTPMSVDHRTAQWRKLDAFFLSKHELTFATLRHRNGDRAVTDLPLRIEDDATVHGVGDTV